MSSLPLSCWSSSDSFVHGAAAKVAGRGQPDGGRTNSLVWRHGLQRCLDSSRLPTPFWPVSYEPLVVQVGRKVERFNPVDRLLAHGILLARGPRSDLERRPGQH